MPETPGSYAAPSALPVFFPYKQQFAVLLPDSFIMYFHFPNSILMLLVLIFPFSFEQCFIITADSENLVPSPSPGTHTCKLVCLLALSYISHLFPVSFSHSGLTFGRLAFIVCIMVIQTRSTTEPSSVLLFSFLGGTTSCLVFLVVFSHTPCIHSWILSRFYESPVEMSKHTSILSAILLWIALRPSDWLLNTS